MCCGVENAPEKIQEFPNTSLVLLLILPHFSFLPHFRHSCTLKTLGLILLSFAPASLQSIGVKDCFVSLLQVFSNVIFSDRKIEFGRAT